MGHGGALRVDRKLLDRVERDFRAVDAALGPVRILGADAYMRVQACTWSLNTADFERRPGKGHRNANGISADVISQGKECTAVEGEIEQSVGTLGELGSRRPCRARKGEGRGFESGVHVGQPQIKGVGEVEPEYQICDRSGNQVQIPG